jgi:hypothetical protein
LGDSGVSVGLVVVSLRNVVSGRADRGSDGVEVEGGFFDFIASPLRKNHSL